jgi:hypothetical protein
MMDKAQKLDSSKFLTIITDTTKFLQITGIVNQVLKPSKLQKQTRLRIYSTLSIPTLLYGSETWTLMEQDKAIITATRIKVFRKAAKYTIHDHKRNQDITKNSKHNQFRNKSNI